MTVQHCTNKGRPAFRWGDKGYAYPYNPADPTTRNRAWRLAKRQDPNHKAVIQHFSAAPFHLSEREIKEYVSPAAKDSITGKTVKAFAIAHDGAAEGRMAGVKGKMVHYLRSAVEKLYEKLPVGLKAYAGHTQVDPLTNKSETSRQPVGQVVGKTLRDVGGRLFNVVLVAFDDAAKNAFDVASMEAIVRYANSPSGPVIDDVDEITGIALGSSQSGDKPGFPAATLLGAFQAFKENTMPKTKEEIMADIAEADLSVQDIFSKDEVLATKWVKEHVHSERQTPHEHAKRLEKKLGEVNAEKDEMKATIDKLTRDNLGLKASPLLDKLMESQELTGKKADFLRSRFTTNFSMPEDADSESSVNTALKNYIKTQSAEFDSLAKLFGGDNGDSTGGKSGETGMPAPKENLGDADKNPFMVAAV